MSDPDATTPADDAPETIARPRRHPAIGIAVILIAAWLLQSLWESTSYFLLPSEPKVYEAPVDLAKLEVNSFVKLTGAPDRRRAIIVEGRWGNKHSIFRLARNASRLWVSWPRDDTRTAETLSDEFSGRLVRFGSVPYAGQVRRHYYENVTMALDLTPAVLMSGAGIAEPKLKDKHGEAVAITSSSVLFVGAEFSGEYRLHFDLTKYPEPAETDRIVAKLGLPWAELPQSRLFRAYLVRADEQAAAKLTQQFSDPALMTGVFPRIETYVSRWGQLKKDGDQLLLNPSGEDLPPQSYLAEDGRLVPQDLEPPFEIASTRIKSAEIVTPMVIPEDALILLDDETPKSYWLFPVLSCLLIIVILGNIIVLARRLRTA